MTEVTDKIKAAIRDIPDFPKPGILFKDITPVLSDPELCRDITKLLASKVKDDKIDAVVGVESRGFWFGMLLAEKLSVPFIPIRKAGKLPYKTISFEYNLEYGTSKVEMHEDAIKKGWNVLVHDDLLATGGTAAAAAQLIRSQEANVAGFLFLVGLDFLNGKEFLKKYINETKIISLVNY
jgi:adenine phosphoribosyltransferase